MNTKKGSVLAYSLIILAIMLTMAASLSVVTVSEKKTASSAEFSTQSLQAADSGVQLAIKDMKDNITASLSDIYGAACSGGVITGIIDADKGTYELTFYSDKSGTALSQCSDQVDTVKSIKSVGTYKNTVRAIRVSVSIGAGDKYAYVISGNNNNLQIINITNPSTPISEGTFSSGISPSGIAVSEPYAYIVNEDDNTLQIFDISIPASAHIVGSIVVGNSPRGVAVSGNYAYVVNNSANTMQIVDISSHSNPKLIGPAIATQREPVAVAVSENYAYVVNNRDNNVQVIDVSAPASASVKRTITTSNAPVAITVSGNYAYIINTGAKTMQVMDISTPISASIIGASPALGGNPIGIAVSGSYAYIPINSTDRLQVIDIAIPVLAHIEKTQVTSNRPMSVAISETYVCIPNNGPRTMEIFDISDINSINLLPSPISVGRLPVGVATSGV